MKDKIKVFCSMPRTTSQIYFDAVCESFSMAKEAGYDPILEIDWHMLDPYHGPPPHLKALQQKQKIPTAGYGYAPFGWKKGWIWMMDKMGHLFETVHPSYILYGHEPYIRNGWGWDNDLRDPMLAGYNDTVGVLAETLERMGWFPDSVMIPWLGTNQRMNLAIKRAKTKIPYSAIVNAKNLDIGYFIETSDPVDPDTPDTTPLEDAAMKISGAVMELSEAAGMILEWCEKEYD